MNQKDIERKIEIYELKKEVTENKEKMKTLNELFEEVIKNYVKLGVITKEREKDFRIDIRNVLQKSREELKKFMECEK